MPIEVEKMRFNQYYVTSLFEEVVQEAFNEEPPQSTSFTTPSHHHSTLTFDNSSTQV